MAEIEIWKVIPGYEGLYEASTLGNVRSLNYKQTKKIKNLTFNLTKNGYLRVHFKNKVFGVHQIIAMTFLDFNCQGHSLVIDHINEIKTDNRVENIQLLNNRQNVTKSIERNLPVGVYKRTNRKKYFSKINIKGVRKYLGYFNTVEEASEAYQKALIEIN